MSASARCTAQDAGQVARAIYGLGSFEWPVHHHYRTKTHLQAFAPILAASQRGTAHQKEQHEQKSGGLTQRAPAIALVIKRKPLIAFYHPLHALQLRTSVFPDRGSCAYEWLSMASMLGLAAMPELMPSCGSYAAWPVLGHGRSPGLSQFTRNLRSKKHIARFFNTAAVDRRRSDQRIRWPGAAAAKSDESKRQATRSCSHNPAQRSRNRFCT